MADALLPCPFCGTEVAISVWHYDVTVKCRSCEASITIPNRRGVGVDDRTGIAIAAWNLRSLPERTVTMPASALEHDAKVVGDLRRRVAELEAQLAQPHPSAWTPTHLPAATAPVGDASILWCVVRHIGTDDIYPVESYETAVKLADAINDRSEASNFGHKPDSIDYVFSRRAYPAPWTGTPESHAFWLEKAGRAAHRTGETHNG